ncbi:MAG: fatty acid desaturase [Candidatus Omnitrophica bacterium]|nr:fatty acid desaturase [Candidatus Omnitrophota bacterium]
MPTRIKWDILAGIVIVHLGALLALFHFSWSAFWVFVILQLATGMGVTLCYHRLLTHRSFQVPKWLQGLLTLCGVLALQGGPLKWVATHRVHHAFSDRPNDPHSPNKGFWWAHMLWLFVWVDQLDVPEQFVRFVPDLARDPVQRFFEKANVPLNVACGALLFALGGWAMLAWGFFLRLVFVYHGTWLVNSASHLWGYQSYETNEGSRNNWWVALLSYGEGWHNNHHAYPHSAAHGLRWWEVDITYLAIRFLAFCKLATRIRLPQGNPAQLPAFKPVAVPKLKLPVPSLSV